LVSTLQYRLRRRAWCRSQSLLLVSIYKHRIMGNHLESAIVAVVSPQFAAIENVPACLVSCADFCQAPGTEFKTTAYRGNDA